jgi:hypothetical protein
MAKKLRTVQQTLGKARDIVAQGLAIIDALRFENGMLVNLVVELASLLQRHGLSDDPEVIALRERITEQLEAQAARIGAVAQGQA